MRILKTVIVDELRLSPGARVLEVGCGTGDDARLLAGFVGQDGRVVGIDPSEAMIGVAQERSSDSSVPVEFALGDVLALKYPDDAFDACRCERVLMHADGDPARGIDEMVRVTRPGGRIAILDLDWDALVIDHPDRAGTRTIVHAVCDGIRNGRIGSQLPRLMSDAGLVEVVLQGRAVRFTHSFLHRLLDGHLSRAQEEGRLDGVELTEWWRALDEAESRGQFMAALVAFIASGAVPPQARREAAPRGPRISHRHDAHGVTMRQTSRHIDGLFDFDAWASGAGDRRAATPLARWNSATTERRGITVQIRAGEATHIPTRARRRRVTAQVRK